MGKVFFAMFLVLVLAIDWAAFHDILKGEPEIRQESLFILLSALLFLSLSICGLWSLRKGRGI